MKTLSFALTLFCTTLGVLLAQDSPPGTPSAWYKADAGLVTSGSQVTSWQEQLGGYHLDQVIGNPSTLSLTSNSTPKNIVRFDGNDALWAAHQNFHFSADRTVVIYARVNDDADGFLFDGSSNSGLSRAQIRNNQWQIGVQPNGGGDNADWNTSAVTTGQWQTHVFTYDRWLNWFSFDHSVQHWIDGTLAGSHNIGTDTGLVGLILGANVSGQRMLNVDIAEVLIYGGIHSQTDVEAAHAYLSGKWGQPADTTMSHTGGTAEQTSQSLIQQAASYPLIALRIDTAGSLSPFDLTSFQFDLQGTTDTGNIAALKIFAGDTIPNLTGVPNATIASGFDSTITANLTHTLSGGSNHIWVVVETKAPLTEGDLIDARILNYTITGPQAGTHTPSTTSPAETLTVGDGVYSTIVRKGGDDGSGNFRIPALITTNAGTLIAGFDVRWDGNNISSPDLPANMDTAIMRSLDEGITWQPMQIIMDYDANESGSQGNGVGDPSLLVDRTTGRIWCASLWSKGNNGWNGSGPGLTADQTGQFVVNYSDDDGVTWTAPVSITSQIKDPAWDLYFQGPGKGFSTREGALIFPAQYRDAGGTPRSNFIYSTDHGTSWHTAPAAISSGNPWTTESQMVELDNGDLMISMRNHDGSKRRLWCIYSWDHDTETIADGSWGTAWHDQTDPTVMGSVQRYSSTLDGYPSSVLLFANPDSTSREKMTIRASTDEGQSWAYSRKIDDLQSAYSCMTKLPSGDIGILYETGESSSISRLVFMRFPLSWLVGTTDTDRDGMTDFYEDTNGLNKNSDTDAVLDPDNDGMNNLQEFHANTNAQDANSKLVTTSIIETSSGIRLSWQSVPSQHYVIESSETLNASSWIPVSGYESIQTSSTQGTVEIPATSDSKRFFRVRSK